MTNTLPTIRHYIGDVGYGACGHPLGVAGGGDPSNGEEPSTEFEQEHIPTTSGGLYSAYARYGATAICRPCFLHATEQLMETAPHLVPEWAKDDRNYATKLQGAYPPEPDIDWDQEAPF